MQLKKISYRIITSFVVLSLCTLLVPLQATAQSSLECDSDFYSSNNVLFFNPCDVPCGSAGGSAVSLPTATVEYLDGRGVRELAEQNMERYKAAEAATGVIWQAVAAIHYREAGMNPNSSVFNGAALGSGINVDGQNVVSDPNEDAINAMNVFIGLAKSVYEVDVTNSSISTEEWGNAFLAYNRGFLYKWHSSTYNDSPYVMNGYDSSHMNMSWVGPPSDPAVSGEDGNKAGALSVLAYLAVNTDSMECAGGGSAVMGDAIKTALAFALDYPLQNGQNDVSLTTEAYRNAFPSFNSAAFEYPWITDCGRFVSTVMRASEVDPDFAEVLVSTNIIPYMEGSGKYEHLGSVGFEQLLPGDIITTPGHILLFTGPNGDYVAVDASFEDRTPSVRTTDGVAWMIGEGARVWRLK